MAYAFDGVAWGNVPNDEQLAVAIMQAEVRDSFLTDAEWRVANAIRRQYDMPLTKKDFAEYGN